MRSSSNKAFTLARIISLAVIAVMAVGLLYLRLAPDVETLTVPEAAQAGDLTLEPCSYTTEDGDYAADCGTLVVSEDQTDPESPLIAVPVIRIRARSPEPAEPIFYLTGGPGQSNMEAEHASRYVADRDFVMVGYRGVDGSVRLDCPEVSSVMKRSTDWLSEEHHLAYTDAFQTCAERFAGEGIDVANYGLARQVDDLETVRIALAYDQINLLSESAGTRTAQIYSWRYPESLHRSVMLGVNPPGAFLWDAEITDVQIGRYATLCAADADCSGRTDDLAASMRRVSADIPERWWFLPIKEANVQVVSFFGLFESTPAGSPTPAPVTLDAWLSAEEGDASGFWFTSVLGDFLMSDLFTWGQWASGGMLDANAAREYFSSDGPEGNLGFAATTSGWGGGLLADSWPEVPEESQYSQVRTTDVETLVISGELDVSTPPQVATRELLPSLTNGHEVVLPGFGHTGTLFAEQPEASNRLINTFFATGQVDDSLYVPQSVDFTPSIKFGALAKITLATMLGLAALTLFSLFAMARRVHKRGRFGALPSFLLRSLYPIVLGLGGWFLCSLIVLATMPAVRIDNELLVVLSVGAPVGLSIYWAWVDQRGPIQIRRLGVAVASSSALIGAWLGYNATDGLLSLLTAIVGSMVAANLAVLIIDISKAREEQRHAGSKHRGVGDLDEREAVSEHV